ncbi:MULTISPECIES: site-specific integrase [Rhizobium]|uniref:Integrase n=1 Tax=Rhizobium paranaense TaxID=1650438 RepID=A0A7W8XWR2_9HYPH|nr:MULTISPECIES: site-specific integrase [Rhizobium]MBB5576967.1 integrase [Rhizobium paranaense]PST61571.1 hypothetical protein C9E91_19420 [Rhizobium sp. SEMIA4064]
MYFTQSAGRFRFQIRVPRDLVEQLGSTPLRITLKSAGVSAAKKTARLLAGHAEGIFITVRNNGPINMTIPDMRGVIIDQLVDLLEATYDEAISTLELQQEVRRKEIKALTLKHYNEQIRQHSATAIKIKEVGERIERLQKQADQMGSNGMQGVKADLDGLARLVALSLDGGPQRPLLSESLEQWTNEIRYHEGIDPKKVRTDQNRINDFKEFAGDKPVNKYEFFDFQKFASLLARVPSNYSKLPELKGKTRQEAADYNNSLSPEDRLDTLAGKSIEDNYLSPLRMFFRDMAAQYQFRSPLTDVIIRIPKDAKESVDRVPFEVEDLNAWFAHAATLSRPDHKWLPLLGTITGARVGELVYLQGKDVYPMIGASGQLYWVLDLRTDLIDDDGGKEKRQLKNKPSRRLIALHEVFEETGFIKYARDRDATQWVFPAAFWFNKGEVKDPADAASKRMNNMLKKVGIHKSIESTFHSTRHNAKDAMRLARIDERTSDLQSGHRLSSVSQNYGKKHLKTEEVEVLRAMPLPPGLDLSPYLQKRERY